MVSDYQSISCIQHEQLEFSVLRKIPLFLVYRLDGVELSEIVLPLDVSTHDGAEWLKFRGQGGEAVIEIRLDWIVSFRET